LFCSVHKANREVFPRQEALNRYFEPLLTRDNLSLGIAIEFTEIASQIKSWRHMVENSSIIFWQFLSICHYFTMIQSTHQDCQSSSSEWICLFCPRHHRFPGLFSK